MIKLNVLGQIIGNRKLKNTVTSVNVGLLTTNL